MPYNADQSLKITAVLSHFKLRTPMGEWACDCQQIAMKQSPPNFRTWAKFKRASKEHFILVKTELSFTQKIHNLKMNNCSFTEWYQDWIVHTTHSNANNATKMYAFWQNLFSTLHNKIMAIHFTPTTLAHLVELAKEFDQIWQMYNQSNITNQWCTIICSTNTKSTNFTSVNATDTPPCFQTSHYSVNKSHYSCNLYQCSWPLTYCYTRFSLQTTCCPIFPTPTPVAKISWTSACPSLH